MTDFTEDGYRAALRLALARYPCLRFADWRSADTGILWRHDIDVSPHRALALAKIEQQEGARATYFVHLHSMFYNAFEDDVVARLREIALLGHDIGLHFDLSFCAAGGSAADRVAHIAAEAEHVRTITGRAPTAVSLHNPPPVLADGWDADELAGLVNAYGRQLRGRFEYCSDSNGIWRHQPLHEVLLSGAPRLQVLTHPEWWGPEPMSPQERMMRAVDGRSASVWRRYRRELARTGRHEP